MARVELEAVRRAYIEADHDYTGWYENPLRYDTRGKAPNLRPLSGGFIEVAASTTLSTWLERFISGSGNWIVSCNISGRSARSYRS